MIRLLMSNLALQLTHITAYVNLLFQRLKSRYFMAYKKLTIRLIILSEIQLFVFICQRHTVSLAMPYD